MDYHSQKAARCCAYAPAAPAHQAFFSLLPPRAKLQFPGGSARSGLEVGSLEVTRATGAGGVSSERCGAGRRGRGAREAGSRDAQVCGSRSVGGRGPHLRMAGNRCLLERERECSEGWRPARCRHQFWGRRRWDSSPPDLEGLVSAWLNFLDVLPGSVRKSMKWESGCSGFASWLCHSPELRFRGNRAEPQFPLSIKRGGRRGSTLCWEFF